MLNVAVRHQPILYFRLAALNTIGYVVGHTIQSITPIKP